MLLIDTEAQRSCSGSHSLERIQDWNPGRSDSQALVFPLHILLSVHVETEG